ncbi:unnamed protein product [Plutella xylostella]|uniref:(diamondback moth) hypothetical protein n=1 Tax=Plutella xylostella TaxID=51655 RepID=A0A8S4FN38_PLUXY|nr:unnamed protein product [Plutella xylostella]
MGGTLSNFNHFISSLLFSCERVSLFGSACVAVTFLLSSLTVLALAGVGAGHNYCYVHFHSVYIDKLRTTTTTRFSLKRFLWRQALRMIWFFHPVEWVKILRRAREARLFHSRRGDTAAALRLLRRLRDSRASYNVTLHLY